MASRRCSLAALFTIFMALVGNVGATTIENEDETCQSLGACEEVVRSSAMLQVHAAPTKTASTDLAIAAEKETRLQEAHLFESRDCIPVALQEMHVQAIRSFAASQVKVVQSLKEHAQHKEKENQPDMESATTPPPTPVLTPAPAPAQSPAPAPESSDAVTGDTATLDAAGFKAVTSLCCPLQMEAFFNRVIGSMGMDICSKLHVQGLMHWFSCVPDMDFQYMLDVINNGNPCKYWTASGASCPTLSPECAGTFCR